MRLLDEEGLMQMSLRKLAKRLNVSVSSLYGHVCDKEELFYMVAGHIYVSAIENARETHHWTDWLQALGLSIWDIRTKVRDAHTLIIFTDISYFRNLYSEELSKELINKGFPAVAANEAHLSVQSLAFGWETLRSHDFDALEMEFDMFQAVLDLLIDGWRSKCRNFTHLS